MIKSHRAKVMGIGIASLFLLGTLAAALLFFHHTQPSHADGVQTCDTNVSHISIQHVDTSVLACDLILQPGYCLNVYFDSGVNTPGTGRVACINGATHNNGSVYVVCQSTIAGNSVQGSNVWDGIAFNGNNDQLTYGWVTDYYVATSAYGQATTAGGEPILPDCAAMKFSSVASLTPNSNGQ